MYKIESERALFTQSAREVIAIEQEAIANLAQQLTDDFDRACETLLNCQGRVIILGIGKSGHIGRKIAATLASTGTPAFFIHPAEACHGDSGMISTQDVVIAISYSGETEELINLLPLIRLLKLKMIAITGNPNSTLSKNSSYTLNIRVKKEACPLGLAPTASTTATLVMGDALAVSLLKARGFNSHDFARYHPSGSLGKRLLMRVGDLMHSGTEIPTVFPTCTIATALMEMTEKRLGMTAIIDENHKLLGIYTDGDLRRTLDRGFDIHQHAINQVMTTHYTNVTESMLAVDALTLMREKKITILPVTTNQQIIIGILHMHDLLKAGVV